MSPIQRFEPLMKISFKFNHSQFIFYGILKRSSMYAKNMDTPLIHNKIEYIFDQRGFLPGTYDYNEVIRIFNDIPKFEIVSDDLTTIEKNFEKTPFRDFLRTEFYLLFGFILFLVFLWVFRTRPTKKETKTLKNDEELKRFMASSSRLKELPLYIDDSSLLSPMELRARARRVSRQEGGLSLVVVDYLQLMQLPGSTENRVNQISEISRSLKALAKELNIPVIALSQLNRGVEQRPNKRPMMADLRDSGAIEQDADVILFIYRDEVYNEGSEHGNKAEIIIGKQRNGPIGIVNLSFLKEFTRFEDFAVESYYDSFE